MEYVILGLLMLRQQTMYDLKKAFEERIGLFYSASFGSIGTAIARLLEKEWIALDEQVERGRNKKIYAIAPAGSAAFQEWLGSHIPSEKVREPALTRLFFMGFLPAGERIAVIESHIAALEDLAAGLALLHAEAERADIPAEKRELAEFQLLTLRYGRDYYDFSIAWFKRLLTSLKEQAHDSR
ncbi:MAG TPA: helix-turn-helix transcriptional regulator [Herpetosiphonaceae bacterium]|nr:helix-turn-helix transcriptional regulator [Herpetosiphonaceae bacterium]